MKKYIVILLVLFPLVLVGSNTKEKLKMACDIGNEKSCIELKQYLAPKKEHGQVKKSSDISDNYNEISCPTVVLEQYPALNKHYNKVIWKDVNIGYKKDWEEFGVTSPLDAIRWGDMLVRPSNYYYGELKKLGITKPIEAKKWLCANVWNGNDGNFVYSIRQWIENGIITPKELTKYLTSKNEATQINQEHTKIYRRNIKTNTTSCPTLVPNMFMWRGHGFSAEEARAWSCAGIDRRDAKDWRKLGVKSANAAQVWIRLDVGLYIFRNLTRIGIKSPKQVKNWNTAGVNSGQIEYWIEKGIKSPEEAKNWLDAGITLSYITEWEKLNISADEAKQWMNIGIKDKYKIRDWKELGIPTREALEWKQLGFNIYSIKNWMESGITTAKKAKAWIAIGVKNNNDIYKWKKSGLDTPKEANKWLLAGFPKGYLWESTGFSIDEAKQWLLEGIPDGYKYKKEGLSNIGEAVEAKECRQRMTYKVFNNIDKGVLHGTLIQSLPHGYIISSGMNELYFVPKFDKKFRRDGMYIVWLVESRGDRYTYSSVGNGTMQAAKVHYLGKNDKCSKYMKVQEY